MNNLIVKKQKKKRRKIEPPQVSVVQLIALILGALLGYFDTQFVTNTFVDNFINYILLLGSMEFGFIFLVIFIAITRVFTPREISSFKLFFITLTIFFVMGHVLANLVSVGQINYFHVIGLIVFNTAGTFSAYYVRHRLHS